jgi:hypothetical protein
MGFYEYVKEFLKIVTPARLRRIEIDEVRQLRGVYPIPDYPRHFYWFVRAFELLMNNERKFVRALPNKGEKDRALDVRYRARMVITSVRGRMNLHLKQCEQLSMGIPGVPASYLDFVAFQSANLGWVLIDLSKPSEDDVESLNGHWVYNTISMLSTYGPVNRKFVLGLEEPNSILSNILSGLSLVRTWFSDYVSDKVDEHGYVILKPNRRSTALEVTALAMALQPLLDNATNGAYTSLEKINDAVMEVAKLYCTYALNLIKPPIIGERIALFSFTYGLGSALLDDVRTLYGEETAQKMRPLIIKAAQRDLVNYAILNLRMAAPISKYELSQIHKEWKITI